MGFFAGALQGSRNMLGRRLANMYRDERDAVADDRWERTHALNRATTQSNLESAEQARTFAAALHPHSLTAAELSNFGTEQAIQQSAALHPHRVTGASLANALNRQTLSQRGELHPLNVQLTRGQLTQQGLTTDRMRDDNAFMQEYRPGLLEAQRIANESSEMSLHYLPQHLQEQIRAVRQATDQSAELHPWNLAMSALRYGLKQAELSSEYANMAQARGRGFADKIKDLKQSKGWFAPEMSEYQILEMIKNEGRAIRGNLGNAFRYTPDDIHRYASSFMTGMANPEVLEQYNEMLQRLGKNPQGIIDLENKMFNAFWQGVYGKPDPKLTPEQEKMIGKDVIHVRDRPTALQHIRNLQSDIAKKISDLSAEINQQLIAQGAANPATQQALETAIAEAKRLGL